MVVTNVCHVCIDAHSSKVMFIDANKKKDNNAKCGQFTAVYRLCLVTPNIHNLYSFVLFIFVYTNWIAAFDDSSVEVQGHEKKTKINM